MLRVTADSNIYISALNFGGLPDKSLDLARAGEIQIVLSDAVVDEVSRVLHNKFGWTFDAVLLAQAQLSGFTERVKPKHSIEIVKEDPTDNRILECAEAGKCGYIVTGDKHLLKLGQFAATRVVTPAEFLEILAQTGRRIEGTSE